MPIKLILLSRKALEATAIQKYAAEQPITRFYGWTLPPGLPPEWVDEHLALFAREVIPSFRRD